MTKPAVSEDLGYLALPMQIVEIIVPPILEIGIHICNATHNFYASYYEYILLLSGCTAIQMKKSHPTCSHSWVEVLEKVCTIHRKRLQFWVKQF